MEWQGWFLLTGVLYGISVVFALFPAFGLRYDQCPYANYGKCHPSFSRWYALVAALVWPWGLKHMEEETGDRCGRGRPGDPSPHGLFGWVGPEFYNLTDEERVAIRQEIAKARSEQN